MHVQFLGCTALTKECIFKYFFNYVVKITLYEIRGMVFNVYVRIN